VSDSAKLRVLVTNDDGVHAPALDVLAARLGVAGHAVQVVAPPEEHSGCGASIGRMQERLVIATKQVSLPRSGIMATAVDAPPALAALAGCQGLFGPRPDVVVSGINSGFNTGPMVLHSGTLGAAMTAAAHGVPAIALSTERDAMHGFATAAEFCARWLESMTRSATELSATNVNVPDLPFDELAGARATTLGRHSLVSIAITPDEGGLRLRRSRSAKALAADTDVEAIRDGYVSITKIYAGVRDLPAEESPWLT
jgi:5'-nucleotidase